MPTNLDNLVSDVSIQVLGDCSGELRDTQGTASYLLDDRVAIDAGTGLANLTVEQTAKLDHVVLSHQHFDHICMLPLILNTHFDRYLKNPLKVWTHPETIAAIKNHVFNDQIWPDFVLSETNKAGLVEFIPVEHNTPTHVAGFELTLIPVVHSVISSAVALRSTTGGAIYSSDTMTNDALWQFINEHPQFNILFIECTFPDAHEALAHLTKHYCPKTLVADLAKLKRPIQVFLSHSADPVKETILAECQAQCSESLSQLTSLGFPKVRHPYPV